MSGHGRLYVPSGATAAAVAAALAWLWRLGPPTDSPDPDAVGIGDARHCRELGALARDGRLAGAIVFCDPAGSTHGEIPKHHLVEGAAEFEPGGRSKGTFTVFDAGQPVVQSSLGAHAVREGPVLFLGSAPAGWWGRLEAHWILDALAVFLPEVLGRPLVTLPAVGVARLDDAPGTAQHQLEGRSKSDAAGERLARGLHRAYGDRDASLNVAVAAEALLAGERVPLDRVWPDAVRALAQGVADGALEPVCHGLLHLVPETMVQGRIDYLEFGELDEQEAGRRIDAALEWHERCLGKRPTTFCAPAWGYSGGARAAAAARDLPVWLPPQAGPLLDKGGLRETLDPALHGLDRFDLTPFARWAQVGLPPTVVFHGRTFDLRMQTLRKHRDLLGLARTVTRRDIYRVPSVSGVTWVKAGEYADLLRAHDRIEVHGADIDLRGATHARLRDGHGSRPAAQV